MEKQKASAKPRSNSPVNPAYPTDSLLVPVPAGAFFDMCGKKDGDVNQKNYTVCKLGKSPDGNTNNTG